MSNLLKRTKKSCLKIFRKISSSKQLFAKKSEDDTVDDTINNKNNNNNNSNNSNGSSNSNNNNNSNSNANSVNNSNCNLQYNNNANCNNGNGKKINQILYKDYAMEMETSPSTNSKPMSMQREKVNHSFRYSSTESLPSTTYQRNENNISPKFIQNININNNNNNNKNNSNTRPLVTDLKADMDDEESPNNTILHKLTARLFLTADGYDFQRLQQLRSDTGSEVVQFDTEMQQQEQKQQQLNDNNIVFEKVKFKDDVRYFRHTPSNSSLDNFGLCNSIANTPPIYGDCDDDDYDLDNDWQVNEHCQHRPWNLEPLTNQFTNFGFQATTTTTSTSTTAQSQPQPQPQRQQQHQQLKDSNNYRPTICMTLGSKHSGNLQNVIISETLDNQCKLKPIIKWDINGNSLDDDDDDLLPHEYLEDFDKRLSKRIAAVQQFQQQRDLENDNDDSEDSSLRSSSTTLETWVDEDLLVESSLDSFNTHVNRCLTKT